MLTNDGCGGRCGHSISELSTSEDGHGSVVVTCALVPVAPPSMIDLAMLEVI